MSDSQVYKSLKLIHSTGTELTVREASEPIYRVKQREGGPPIKHNGWRLTSDAEAREMLNELRATGLYYTERLV